MHSSPSLAPLLHLTPAAAFIVAGALMGSSCQDAKGGSTPAESPEESEREVTRPETMDAATPASRMTQVGAPSTSPGASGAKAPAEEDAAAPNPPDPMREEPGMAAPDLTCSADSACKTVDSMCGSCRCLILPSGMAPPACTEPTVTCLVAPCLNKRAVCSAAMCALQDEGPNAM